MFRFTVVTSLALFVALGVANAKQILELQSLTDTKTDANFDGVV